jgi:cell fate regulator YaaT (PSP1 superfamily)
MNNSHQALVRYGAIPEVVYFNIETDEPIQRGSSVVVRTSRGEEMGELLQDIQPEIKNDPESGEGQADLAVLREASEEDQKKSALIKSKSSVEFSQWEKRIQDWNLDLVLIDLDSTLNEKSAILYVLNGRGSDCTVLAIKAAASGLGNVHVQPVDENGMIQVLPSGGGGCGSSGGSCGCSE